MRTVRFIGYKISPVIDLKKVAAYFRLQIPESWEDCIILDEQQLAEVYKYKMLSKKIYIFEFGCITFENFHTDETGKFLKYIRLITGNMDYKMLARYNESLDIKVFKNHSVSLWKGSIRTFPYSDGLAGIVAVVLAKSVALSKIEADVDPLLDKAESFIAIMSTPSVIQGKHFNIPSAVKNLVAKPQNGALNSGTRRFAATMAHIVKFEYNTAVGIKIFDRPSEAKRDLALRSAYDELANNYELDDRYNALEKKVAELRNIAHSYSVLRYWRQENRLLLFEIFLLALFPLSYFIRAWLH